MGLLDAMGKVIARNEQCEDINRMLDKEEVMEGPAPKNDVTRNTAGRPMDCEKRLLSVKIDQVPLSFLGVLQFIAGASSGAGALMQGSHAGMGVDKGAGVYIGKGCRRFLKLPQQR